MKHQQNHLFYVDEQLLHIELVLKFLVQKYFGLGVPVKKNHVRICSDYLIISCYSIR